MKTQTAGIETEFASFVVRKASFASKVAPIETVGWLWPVKIITLGGFDLELGGDSVCFIGKIQKKPLLLLKVLIALGGKDVREAQLTDILWPEADGDQAHSAFTTTMMRLRRLLGKDGVITIRHGMVSLNSCWVDAWAFEAMVDRLGAELKRFCEELKKGNNSDEKILEIADKAACLYGGSFLTEEGCQPWALPLRRKLRRKYIQLVIGLGSALETMGLWEKAAHYYIKALDTDEIDDEVLYQRLMICHCRLGQSVRAVDVYQQCRKVLAMSFGVKPSSAIEVLYQGLVQ